MRIKEILKAKGMTINELATKLNISRQALSKQIQGKMLVETAQKIATALDVPIWQLFASEEEVKPDMDAPSITCPHCGKPIHIKVE